MDTISEEDYDRLFRGPLYQKIKKPKTQKRYNSRNEYMMSKYKKTAERVGKFIHSDFYHNLNDTETDIINHVLKTIKKNPSKFDLDNDFRNTILEFLSNKIGNKSKKQFEKEWNKSIA